MAVFTVLALAITWPVLATADLMNVFRDAQVLYAYERDAAWGVLRFASAPLWDPYYCGGLYALGTPQSRFVSPTFILSLVFGPARGEALTVFAMIILGLEGTFRYARARGGGSLGSFLAAPAFAVSGTFIAAPFLGWTNFFGFELVPWVLLFVRRALRGDTAAGVAAALFLAWIVGFGGTYAGPLVVLLIGYELAEQLLAPRRKWLERKRAIGLCVFMAALAVGVAAIRLAPLLETLNAAPRVIAGKPGMTAVQAFDVLILPVTVTDGNLVWSKQMYTVGACALALSLLGLLRRRFWPLVPLGVLAYGAALGYATGPWGPFALVKRLPLFSALRYPERYLIVVALVAAVSAANGMRLLEVTARWHRRARWALTLGGVLLLLNTGLLLLDFHAVASKRLLGPPPPELKREFQQARGNRWLAAYYAPMSRGSLSCWDAYPVPMSPILRGDLAADEYLLDPTAGTVTRQHWSPNAIDLDVSLTRPTELRVNQNFHPGWRSNAGHVQEDQGLLSVVLPAGSQRVSLRFRPRSAIAGTLSSVFALLAALWLLRRRRGGLYPAGQHARRSALELSAAAGIPLALFAITYGSIPESRSVPAPLRAPSGESVLASRPPEGAIVVGASFDNVIVLEAVQAPAASTVIPGRPASIEIDWRATGPIPHALEISVSFDADGRTIQNTDHELLSAALRPAEAPRGPILRDLVPFVVPASVGPDGLAVWVRLSDSESHHSLPITHSGRATVMGDRLYIASLKPPPSRSAAP